MTAPRRCLRRSTLGVASAALVALAAVACTDDAGPAEVGTLAATGVTASSGTVEGTVSEPSDGTVSYWFEYGTTADYGSETEHRSLEINDRDDHSVSEELIELASETTVHYRACAEGESTTCGPDESFTTASPSSIAADPPLFPAFDPVVTDYVTRCADAPVAMVVEAPEGTEVTVGDEAPAAGRFSQDVDVTVGGRFTFATTTSGATNTYHVRCLPADFPDWTYDRPGEPSADLYITTPANVASPSGERAAPYVVIFDAHGVPVWWIQETGATDAKLLRDGTLGWGKTEPDAMFNLEPGSGFSSYELDGTALHTWSSVDAPTDFHDFQLFDDGNALIGAYPARPGTADLTEYGGPSTGGTLLDGMVQEITPDGDVVWSWSTEDHVDPSETPDRWKPQFVYGLPKNLPDGRKGFDWAHLNSIHQVDDTVLMSFRHLDAVYAVDKTDGEIVWKLGGTPTPESLTVVGDDEEYPLGGQHDARMLPDGTVTVYDNNSEEQGKPPRGVRYEIDLDERTATVVESVSDPDVPISPCCGSATRLTDGSWIMAWGGTRFIGELGPDGERHFMLTFKELKAAFGLAYRVFAVEDGGPTLDELRAGMDAMHEAG